LVNQADRSGHEHFVLSKVLEVAAEIDQVNVPSLVCLEIVSRRLQLIEAAHASNHTNPDWSLADFYMGYASRKGSAIVAPSMSKFGAATEAERSATWKEAREYLKGVIPRHSALSSRVMVCPVDTRQRDLFPLPYVPYERCRQANLSLGTRRRIARSFAKVNEVNDVISSLNSLYDGGSVPSAKFSAGQREVVKRLFSIVSEFGGPVNGPGALQEAQRALLGISHPYSRESCTVVGYDASKVSIPSAGATAVPLIDVLSGRAKEVLKKIEQHMM
jgi:hypothetical protein